MQLFLYLSVTLLALSNGAPVAIISSLNGLNSAATNIPTADSPFSWSVAAPSCQNNNPVIDGPGGACIDAQQGSNAYYQVFLGGKYSISSVAIQSRGSNVAQWVETYKLEYSLDGITFIDANGGTALLGNTGQNSVQTESFDTPFEGRFLRFTPIGFHVYKSFRIEAYGELINVFPSDPAIISQLDGLNPATGAIPTVDSPFSFNVAAPSCKNNYPIIQHTNTGVCLNAATTANAWYQIYLGGLYEISAIALQGRSSCAACYQYVKTYNLEYSLDGITFIDNGINNPLIGNIDMYSLVFQDFGSNKFQARFLRITPVTFRVYKSFRIEAYGNLISEWDPQIISTLPGLNQAATNVATPNSPFSFNVAHQSCKNNYPIIGKNTGVCLNNVAAANAWYKVDLGGFYDISSIAIQGRSSCTACYQYVKTYNLEYSLGGNTFIDNGINNPLTGNIDMYSLRFTIFTSQIEARYLRLTPVTFNLYKSFRFEVYGTAMYPKFPPDEICQSNDVFHYQFILDESGSVTEENFNNYVKPFTSDIIGRDINDKSDISIIIYDSNIIDIHSFDDTQQPRDVMLHALNSRVYDEGETHTGDAIQSGIEQFISQSYTENNIILLLTDGKTNGGIDPCHVDIVNLLNNNNIQLIAIGIGVTIDELGLDCADKKFELESFTQNEFDEIIEELREITCIDCQYYRQVCSIDAQSSAANNNALFDEQPQNKFEPQNNNYPKYVYPPTYNYKSYYDGISDAVIVMVVAECIILGLYAVYSCFKKKQTFKYESVEAIQDV